MRCINTRTGCLEFYPISKNPGYAILSHRWEDEEVTYDDMQKEPSTYQSKKGYRKLRTATEQARADGLDYLWMDTCCINKDSSREVDEAINSMFAWYAEAVVCYAFLADFRSGNPFTQLEKSVWSTRGWTLQELLAPHDVDFYDADWVRLGTKRQLADRVSDATGIDPAYLRGDMDFFAASIAQRMSWAARRDTARLEDSAYSLLGIFRIHMSMNYGEGMNAFKRLQMALIERHPNDQTIFAWSGVIDAQSGLLAPSPAAFGSCGQSRPSKATDQTINPDLGLAITARDISLTLTVIHWADNVYLAFLNCVQGPDQDPLGIFLRKTSAAGNEYKRMVLNGTDTISIDKKIQWKRKVRRRIIVPHPDQRPSTTVNTQRLARIVELDESQGPNANLQVSPASGDISRLSRPTAATRTHLIGFHLADICGLRLADSDIRSLNEAKWNPETKTLTVTPGNRPDSGMLGQVHVSHPDSIVTLISLGLDAKFRPVCYLAHPKKFGVRDDRQHLRVTSRLHWSARFRFRSTTVMAHLASLEDYDYIGNHHVDETRGWDRSWYECPVEPKAQHPHTWLFKGHYDEGLRYQIRKTGLSKGLFIEIRRGFVDGENLWVVKLTVG